MMPSAQLSLETRARRSGGISEDAIYAMVATALATRGIRGGLFLDVGCGSGHLRPFVAKRFVRYAGVDAVRYPDFPADAELHELDLDAGRAPLADGFADVVAAVETIEHLENPRAFVRELTRLARPGGWVVVTTPNQLNILSLLTLIVKQRFVAFQDVHYPAHVTALLEVDLRRIANECGLGEIGIEFSRHGRIALTARHYPSWLAQRCPRACSDNILLIGRKPCDRTVSAGGER
jgi:2-polyprenyl-3-methyl-5-hydroxy-6-metoxy-1,4-benzoquinol methylase